MDDVPDFGADTAFGEYLRTCSDTALENIELRWESVASTLEKECSLKHREAANARSLAAIARFMRASRRVVKAAKPASEPPSESVAA